MKRRKIPNHKQRDPFFEKMRHRGGSGPHGSKRKKRQNLIFNLRYIDIGELEEDELEELFYDIED